MTERYQTGPMAVVWSPEAQYDRWRRVLAAYSGVEIPETDLGAVAAREAGTGHDVAAYLDWARTVTGRPEVGAGLTSSNLVDTALSLAMLEATSILVDDLDGARVGLGRWKVEPGPRLGRTHGQPAEVDTLGRQAGLWSERIKRAIHRLTLAADRAAHASFGGPIGNYATTDWDRAKAAAGALGLRLDADTEQALGRDRIAEWAGAVAAAATALAFVATQIRLGARDGDWVEPTGVAAYKGSSSMPHKRNPTRSERIVGLERVVRALTGAVSESAVWWDLRDISHSSVERVCLPQIAGYTDFMAVELGRVVAGLEIDWDQMAAAVAAHRGSAAMYATALRGGADPEAAYRAVQAVADQV